MSTIIYIRTSTTEQNPENQLNSCISINKWGKYVLYEEQQSAFKDINRPIFDNIIKLIRKRQVKHLICWDLDRLYRNRKKLIELFKICKVYKCSIHSVRQQWLEDMHQVPAPFNEILYDLMLQIMGWIAEEESRLKSERVKAAIRKKPKGTYSYKGNKWGRKGISTFKTNKINSLRKEGMSMRNIANEVSVSVGVVHKTLSRKPYDNIAKKGVFDN